MGLELVVIESKLKEVDVSALVNYTKLVSKIGGLNKMLAPAYMRDFILAMDITNSMLTAAVRLDLEAESALKDVESIAFLDTASKVLLSKGVKDSADARKRYVDTDDDVKKARNIKAKTEALVSFLKNKLQVFRCAHDDVKKIGYGDQGLTNFEGM